MKESAIEAKLVRMVRDRGGLCYKFVSPGNPGVPDRIVITPDGKTIYAELKTEVGRLAAIQKWQITEMQKRGMDVRVLKGLPEVRAFVEEVMPL
ncbi:MULTISPECIES: VRR-NUC domain-containing protein [unclassified Oscillibacter]|uniref:VRR-NUC domain-containing protein n=1 Tax=unclassified Oscillibacter TaxID=2629304 RepID=UPI0025D5B239|nr:MULTISPECIES: VRR-NUC domain-containing protein [unclassified Oscillibacter]